MGKKEKSRHSFDSCLLHTTENHVEQTLGIASAGLFPCLFLVEVKCVRWSLPGAATHLYSCPVKE